MSLLRFAVFKIHESIEPMIPGRAALSGFVC